MIQKYQTKQTVHSWVFVYANNAPLETQALAKTFEFGTRNHNSFDLKLYNLYRLKISYNTLKPCKVKAFFIIT